MTTELDDIPAASICWNEIVGPGAYWSRVIRRGETLRIIDTYGGGCVSLMCWSAAQTSERYNSADTVKVQNNIFPTTGTVLLSDMGRVLMSIVADTSGHHDPICGWSDASSVIASYGSGHNFQSDRNQRVRNSYENFVAAAGRHGLGPVDIVPNLNLFSRVEVHGDGSLHLVSGTQRIGAAVELRAEMDVLVALSNTPHVLDPSPVYAPQEIEVIVRQATVASAEDAVRVGSPQVQRAFENTEAHLGLTKRYGGGPR